MPSDEKFLEQIRKRFDYMVKSWSDIRDEARIDVRYAAGDPWPEAERKAREAAGRLCLSLDEINQYINQKVNDVRMNKRAITVHPARNGADEKTAEFRQALMRQIEYESNAQAAYATGFENVLIRSYGAWRVGTRYCGDDEESGADQEIVIRRIPNPDTVYMDPDCKEADFSDMSDCFVIDRMPVEKFRERWPDAETKSFEPTLMAYAPSWIQIDGESCQIQVAEYWKVKTTKRRQLIKTDGRTFYLDEIKGGKLDGGVAVGSDGQPIMDIANHRPISKRTICQYITNGIEILEENPWPGKYIPIVFPVGREMYVDDGGGSKRMLFSLVRLARDPIMLYCYTRTAEFELVGMSPKTPFVGVEGQFEGHEDEWEKVNKIPLPYLQYKATTGETGSTVLPRPERQPYEPQIQPLEFLAESMKRAIQSATGSYNSSVGRQDTNAKSGVAIKALDQQSDQGNFHFIDNFDRCLVYTGRIIDDLIPHYYDTPREVGIRQPDDTHQVVRINDPNYIDPKTKQPMMINAKQGEHAVAISAGPSFESQRAQAVEFADTLAQNPQVFPQIADLVVRLQNLGPIGDQIAERLTPPQYRDDQGQLPPEVMQKMQQAQEMIMQLTQIVHKLQDEKDAKIPEQETKIRIAEMDNETKQQQIAAQIRIAELNAGVTGAVAQLENQLKAIQHSIDTAVAVRGQDHQVMAQQQDTALQAQQMEQQQAQAEQTPETTQ